MENKKIKADEIPYYAIFDFLKFIAILMLAAAIIQAGILSFITFFKRGIIGNGENDEAFSTALYFSATAPVDAEDLYQRNGAIYIKKDFLDPYLKEDQEELLKEFLFMNAYPAQQVAEKTGFQIYNPQGKVLQFKDIDDWKITVKKINNFAYPKDNQVGYLVGKEKIADLEKAILEHEKFITDQKKFYQEEEKGFVALHVVAPILFGLFIAIGFPLLILRKYP